MPIYKHTLFFRFGAYGWSESFYRSISGETPDFPTERLACGRLADKRKKLLTEHCSIEYLRIAMVDSQPIQSDIVALNGVDVPQAIGDKGDSNDDPESALIVRAQNATRTRKKLLYLRGFEDESIWRRGEIGLTAEFTRRFRDWARQLQVDQFGWLAAKAPTVKPVTSVTSEENGLVTIVTDAGLFPNGVIGKTVVVRGKDLKGCTNLNGALTVRVLNGSSCRTIREIPIFPWTGEGTLRFSEKEFVPISEALVIRAGSRKVGRPSYLSRGRRSAKR